MRATGKSNVKLKMKRDALKYYITELNLLRDFAKDEYSIDERKFEELLNDEFNEFPYQNDEVSLFSEKSLKDFGKFLVNDVGGRPKRYFLFCFVFLVFILCINYKSDLNHGFMRNIQTSIYPLMFYWRKLTMPLLKTFPQLSEFYDEACLIENPFFYVTDLDCWPCINFKRVKIYKHVEELIYADRTLPHILQTKENISVTIDELYSLYVQNKNLFKANAFKVTSTNVNIRNLDHLFDHLINKTVNDPFNSIWKINRMEPARILRNIFPNPKYLPPIAAIGIERFVVIDTQHSLSYKLPSTDCSNMFIHQMNGSRTIHLEPTRECKQYCKRTSVRLKQNSILFYDWWYWKPISEADKIAKSTTITYIGSYC